MSTDTEGAVGRAVEAAEREIAHVFARFTEIVEDVAGNKTAVGATAYQGEKVSLSPVEEARLDSLGALVPKGSEAPAATADVVQRVVETTTRPEGLGPDLPSPITVSPTPGGITPVGDVVTGDTAGKVQEIGAPEAPTIDVAAVPVDAIAAHITDNRLNASDTVALAGGDPALAAKVLEAEHLAQTGDPRATVAKPLEQQASAPDPATGQ